MRLAYEMGQHQEVLLLVECAQEAGALNFNMAAHQRKALERLQRSYSLLEAAILSMDEMCALLLRFELGVCTKGVQQLQEVCLYLLRL
jgi:hypothetical protein